VRRYARTEKERSGAVQSRAVCRPLSSPPSGRVAPHTRSLPLSRAQRRTPLRPSRCPRSAARLFAPLSARAQRRTPLRSPLAARVAPPPSSLPLAARVAPHASSLPLGARVAPHASRRARGRQFSRMPGTETSEKSWKTRSRSANEMADLQRLTEQARAFPGRSAGGPAQPSERAQNESLPPRAAGAARPSLSLSAG